MLYELRFYEVIPGRKERMLDRFAQHTIRILKKHGIETIGIWTEEVGTSNQVVALYAFKDMESRQRGFEAFFADAEWHKVQADTEHDGVLVARYRSRILRPTGFSPMR